MQKKGRNEMKKNEIVKIANRISLIAIGFLLY
jgi:hypothetical protein